MLEAMFGILVIAFILGFIIVAIWDENDED